jgi:hypothetical protein
MDIALFLLAIPICVADMNGFVIPNIYNKMLFYVALAYVSFNGLGDLQDVGISATILTALMFLGTGMGDIKSLALIVMTHTSGAIELLGFVFLLAIVHILVHIGFHRRIPSKIPLAPSIFLGLATYLATR